MLVEITVGSEKFPFRICPSNLSIFNDLGLFNAVNLTLFISNSLYNNLLSAKFKLNSISPQWVKSYALFSIVAEVITGRAIIVALGDGAA